MLVLRASRAFLEVLVSYGEDMLALIREDHLTGLGNQRFFRETGEREVSGAVRYGRSFSVVAIDLDGFKKINDTLGHAAGDRILQRVAETLEGNIRRLDWAFRPGGDEFSLILPGTPTPGAKLLLERIIKELVNTGIKVSYGIAHSSEISLGERISPDEAKNNLFRISQYRRQEDVSAQKKDLGAKPKSFLFLASKLFNRRYLGEGRG